MWVSRIYANNCQGATQDTAEVQELTDAAQKYKEETQIYLNKIKKLKKEIEKLKD